MGDYVPVFKPGEDITLTAGAAITGGQLVALSAANTVVPTSAATGAWIGVAAQDAASGEKVAITAGGVQEPLVGSAVVVGDRLIPAASGRVVPIGAGTDYSQVVGIALTAQSTAGQPVRARFVR